MTKTDETVWASASELASRIRRRELSPVDLMIGTIERIERRNPSLNAFVHLDFEQAMERARAAEAAVASGATLGLLHGVPTAMKDLFDFKPGWQDQLSGHGPSRHRRQLPVRADPQPVRREPKPRRLLGRQRGGGSRRPR